MHQDDSLKVLHVITGLGQGGAESVLYRLIIACHPSVRNVVVSLTDDSYFGPRLRNAGVRVVSLGMPQSRVTIGGIRQLHREIRQFGPDLVQTWMYHADLIGGVVARVAGVRGVAWGIRHSNLSSDRTSLSARFSARACALLSRWVPAAIVCCSRQAAVVHQEIGYVARKFCVIQNGYDLAKLAPDRVARDRVRSAWGVRGDELLLGMVARWDPQKDHENLLDALRILASRGANFRCVFVGKGMERSNAELADVIVSRQLIDRIILAGQTDDVPAAMNALDLHVLSSAGEAFPNAVAEAMACGVPCVVTDVGDASFIVGDTGWVVSPQNSLALADGLENAMAELAKSKPGEIERRCRERIEKNFTMCGMVNAYVQLWNRLAERLD